MRYTVVVAPKAENDLNRLMNSEPKAYRKALALIGELYELNSECDDHCHHDSHDYLILFHNYFFLKGFIK